MAENLQHGRFWQRLVWVVLIEDGLNVPLHHAARGVLNQLLLCREIEVHMCAFVFVARFFRVWRLRLHHREAAVDAEHLSRHPGRPVAAKIYDAGGNVVRLSKPAGRIHAEDGLLALGEAFFADRF